MKAILQNVTGWLKDIAHFGVTLVVIFVMIDILFPGNTTGVVSNVGAVVANFSENGIVGLIALFLFVLIYKK